MRIGFFDSGIGGLTVLMDAIEAYPNAHYIYFADTDNVPYGTKSKKEINKLVLKSVDFLISKKIDILVIACNTATSVSVKNLRRKYSIPIIGMEPAVKPAAILSNAKSKENRILVCATKLTLKEEKLKDLIADLNATDKVDLMSLQKLVRLAEDSKMNSKSAQKYLMKKFSNIAWSEYNSLVLGCTHFLYFKELIRKIIPAHIQILDGNNGTVKRMIALLPAQKDGQKRKTSFYVSGKKIKAKRFKKFMDYYKLIDKNL